jgi:ribosome-binding factor A
MAIHEKASPMSRLDLFTPAKASSHRQKKVSEEIRHHLADALIRGDLPPARHPSGSGFLTFSHPITITKVDASPDLKHATVYIVPLGGVDQERALTFICLQRWYLRKYLGTKIQLRHIPDLHFSLDQSFDSAERIHKMMIDVLSVDAQKQKEYATSDNDQPDASDMSDTTCSTN